MSDPRHDTTRPPLGNNSRSRQTFPQRGKTSQPPDGSYSRNQGAKTPTTKGINMADKAIDVYLNDHLAGAMLGVDLAGQIQARSHGTALGEAMESIAPQIEQDRQTLIELMRQLDSSKNPVKQATAWIAEKVSRAKFHGMTSGEPELGTFMALETLMLGVRGKACMWRALRQVADQYPPLASVNLDELIERADRQYDTLERERLSAGTRALANHVPVTA